MFKFGQQVLIGAKAPHGFDILVCGSVGFFVCIGSQRVKDTNPDSHVTSLVIILAMSVAGVACFMSVFGFFWPIASRYFKR